MAGKVTIGLVLRWPCVTDIMQEVYPHGLKRYVSVMNMLLLLGYHGTLYLYVSYSSARVDATNPEPVLSNPRPKQRRLALGLRELGRGVLVAV